MASLLTPAEKQQIRDAYRDILDTYAQNPVTLRVASGSVDRFNEDRSDITYTDYTFTAITIFTKTPDQNDPNMGGAVDVTKIEVITHVDTLKALGLIDGQNNFFINTMEDLLVVNGKTYIISEATLQGHIDSSEQVKAHIIGQIDKNYYP